MKKFSISLLAVILCISLCLTAFALSANLISDSQAINIETIAVPNEVTLFAERIFEQLTVADLDAMGFSSSEKQNVSLSKGFCVKDISTMRYIDNVYCFMILSHNKVASTLIVTESNGRFGFQIGKDYIYDCLSKVTPFPNDICRVFISDNICYCDSRSSGIITSQVSKDRELQCVREKSHIKNVTDNSSAISFGKCNSVNILNSSKSIQPYSNQFGEYTQNRILVHNVPNETYMDENGEHHGVCWAAAVGAVVNYYTNGTNGSTTSGIYLRNIILNEKYNRTRSYSANTNEMCYSLNLFTDYDYIVANKMSWYQVMSSVDNNKLSVLTYEYLPDLKAHALVLCGYRYLTSNPDNAYSSFIYAMDPNIMPTNGSYYHCMIIGYNDAYMINGHLFEWKYSCLRAN